jgi:3'(2'), 5'-bisphosphate nucleotidase
LSESYAREVEVASRLAREAGRILLEVYDTDYQVIEKADDAGPVTIADKRANDHVVAGLREAFPAYGVVAEESPDTSDAARFERCWFVDPLDGTREFIKHNGEFAVHIGLAVAGEAHVGVVYRPVGDRLYAGIVGQGCWREVGSGARQALHFPAEAPATLRLVASRSHHTDKGEAIRKELGISQVLGMGSVGVKCAVLAEGGADLYVHASQVSSRWDSCAPEAMVRAAGGVLTDMAGVRYRYDGSELANLRGIVACSPAVLERTLPVIERVGREAGLL